MSLPTTFIGLFILFLAVACAVREPTTDACVVEPQSGFMGAGGTQERIVVAKNGAPCVLGMSVRQGPVGDGLISTPPTHGTATVRRAPEATLITYTPAKEYVGADQFVVAFGPDFSVTVIVDVRAIKR